MFCVFFVHKVFFHTMFFMLLVCLYFVFRFSNKKKITLNSRELKTPCFGREVAFPRTSRWSIPRFASGTDGRNFLCRPGRRAAASYAAPAPAVYVICLRSTRDHSDSTRKSFVQPMATVPVASATVVLTRYGGRPALVFLAGVSISVSGDHNLLVL